MILCFRRLLYAVIIDQVMSCLSTFKICQTLLIKKNVLSMVCFKLVKLIKKVARTKSKLVEFEGEAKEQKEEK